MDKRIGSGPRPVTTIWVPNYSLIPCLDILRHYMTQGEHEFIRKRPNRVIQSERTLVRVDETSGVQHQYFLYDIWMDLTQHEITLVALKFGWRVPS